MDVRHRSFTVDRGPRTSWIHDSSCLLGSSVLRSLTGSVIPLPLLLIESKEWGTHLFNSGTAKVFRRRFDSGSTGIGYTAHYIKKRKERDRIKR